MTKFFKKISCFILSFMMVFSSAATVVATAAFSYPEGIEESHVENAIKGTDKLILNAIPSISGSSLEGLVEDGLYTDETVSNILISIYSSMSEGDFDLSGIGINTSVAQVAASLQDYPQVSEKLSTYNSWADVDASSLSWGVSDRESFASAVGSCFSAFDTLLYTLLCSGKMEIGSRIKIEGANGYENAIVPILSALGCENMISQAKFTHHAKTDKSAMVKNILLPVLEMLEKSLSAPMDNFTKTLPTFAEFTVSGKLNEYINILLSPVTENKLVSIMVSLGMFGGDMDVEQMLNGMLSDMSNDGSMKLAPIDFEALASCGTGSGDSFVPDKNKAYVEIMRWLVESLKLNSGDGSSDDMLGAESTDNIVALMIMLFSPQELPAAQTITYPAATTTTVTYTPNVNEADYIRALDEIDPLLDEFVKEGGNAQSIGEVLSSVIYNNDNITALVKGVYGALEEAGMISMLALMGMDVSPKGLSNQFSSLSSVSSWSELPDSGFSWGVSTGSRQSFQRALTSILKPIAPVLRMMLAGEDLVIYNSAVIKGADGYNTAVIPIFEALGCNEEDIKTYTSFKNSSGGDGVITNTLNPIFNLIDEICSKPVYTLVGRLPNILYFLNSGAIEVCLSNMMIPLTALIGELDSVSGAMDVSSLTSSLDIEAMVSGLTSGLGMTFAEFDINSIAGMGTPVARTSKSVVEGKNLTYTYIEADRGGLFFTLLKFIAETMKIPGNEDMLMSTMGSDNSGAFAEYSATLSEQISTMNADELVEWLFNLFFKERVEAEVEVVDDYVPDITYQEPEKSNTGLIVLFVIIGVAAVGVAIFMIVKYTKRNRSYE